MTSEVQIRNHLKGLSPETIAEVAENFGKNCELSFTRRRAIIDDELRAVCFSNPAKVDKLDEILLWSHYARKHEGMRIGFEFPDATNATFQVTEIQYQRNRVEVDFSFELQIEALEAALRKSAATKSIAREYEHEVRLFTTIERCEPRETRTAPSAFTEHFLKFDPLWVKSVDFGALCPTEQVEEALCVLKSNYPHVFCKKADFHKSEYALEYREI
jgi:hypothetical protein